MESSFFSCLSEASPFLKIGWTHILDPAGYDHMLFVVALCCVFRAKEWKRVAWLVTAFTLGHSLTLLLAVKGWVVISSSLVETLIPVTILLTALHNFWMQMRDKGQVNANWQYALAAGFGLIHGLGFSNYLKQMLLEGQCLSGPLFLFNVGLELGQLLIVAITLVLAYVFIERLKVPLSRWIMGISGVIAAMSLYLIFA